MIFNKTTFKVTYKKNWIVSQVVAPRRLTNTGRDSFLKMFSKRETFNTRDETWIASSPSIWC